MVDRMFDLLFDWMLVFEGVVFGVAVGADFGSCGHVWRSGHCSFMCETNSRAMCTMELTCVQCTDGTV